MINSSKHYAGMMQEKYAGMKPGPLLSWDIMLMQAEQELSEELIHLNKLQADLQWMPDIDFEMLIRDKWSLVITDLSQKILWTSSGFYAMTGYTCEEAVGKRPSFLQGEKTSLSTKKLISRKLSNFEPVEARLVNYRKDGEPYLCFVKIRALRNLSGAYSHFLGIEKSIKMRE